MTLLAAVRRLARLPLVGRLTRVPLALRFSFATRGVLVRSPLRFALNELRRAPVTATYRLRESGVAIAIRHHTPDVLVLDELFSQREYEPPPEAATALEALRAPRVVDLGANIGLFGAWVRGRFPGARIDALEPDSGNAEIQALAIAANDANETWTLERAAAATAAGTVEFAPGSFANSRVARAGEPSVSVAAVDVFPLLEGADLVKIDVEGAEWPLLEDRRLRQLRARVVVLEYHEDGCPEPDPEGAATHRLREAGYEVAPGPTKPRYGAGVLWAWRSR